MKITKRQLREIIRYEIENEYLDEGILDYFHSPAREQLLYSPSAMTLNETMLHEGLSRSLVKDAIQFIVSGGAEYGLGAITLPAAGAGLAIGPTVETMVDAAFAAEGVASTISAISSAGSKLGEYGALWNEAVAAYGSDLNSYYQTLVKIVRQALADLGKKGKDKVEEIAKKLQEAIESLISRLVSALKSGIKLVIPDAAIGLAAATAFEEGLEALSENAFDLLASAVNKVKMFKDFVSDPSIAVDFFEDVFKQVVELMLAGAKKLEDMSWVKAIMKGGIGGGAALKKLGPTGLEKAAGLIKEKTPTIIKIIDGVLTVLVPTAITAVGLLQILMTGDWKEEESETTDKQLAASYFVSGNKMILTESRIRKIIREAMLLERKSLATVSDVARFKPQISDWVEVLLDEFSQASSRWDDEEVNEKRLSNMIDNIARAVASALIDVTSGMSYGSKKRATKKEEEKSHKKWDNERKQTGAGVQYYGDFGT
jgi:hypothetical protein